MRVKGILTAVKTLPNAIQTAVQNAVNGGQSGGDVIADVTGSANRFGSGSVRVARATRVASEWIGPRVGCDRVGSSGWETRRP